MSSPRVLRALCRRCRRRGDVPRSAAIASGGERRKPDCGNGLNGIRLNLHGTSATSVDQLARVRVAVVDPVEHDVLEGDEVARRCSRGSGGTPRAARAADTCALIGTSRLRSASLGACSDTASATGHSSRRRSIAGTMPDGRERHAPPRQPVGVVVEHQAQRRQDVVEVEQRLAHAHHHDVGDDAIAAAHGGPARGSRATTGRRSPPSRGCG